MNHHVASAPPGDDKGLGEAPQYDPSGHPDYDTLRAMGDPPPESILQEAERLVTKDRSNTYGPPEQDFTRTAEMWNALFADKLISTTADGFSARDVALAMICLKLSRSSWSEKRDNWVDIVGYAACGHRCQFGEW